MSGSLKLDFFLFALYTKNWKSHFEKSQRPVFNSYKADRHRDAV